MSIRRRWTAQCDSPGCTSVEVLDGDQYDGKWELGILITDRDWEAAPARKETYCPKHNDLEGGGE